MTGQIHNTFFFILRADLSLSEESEEGSIQLLYKIINLENSICMLGASEYSDLVKKRQRRQYQYTYFS